MSVIKEFKELKELVVGAVHELPICSGRVCSATKSCGVQELKTFMILKTFKLNLSYEVNICQ